MVQAGLQADQGELSCPLCLVCSASFTIISITPLHNDPSASLNPSPTSPRLTPFLPLFLKKGTIESLLLGHARTHGDIFEAHVMRPGMVLAKESSLRDLVRGLGPSVKVDKLAAEMVRRVVNGEGGKRKGVGEGKDDREDMTRFVVENGEILSAK